MYTCMYVCTYIKALDVKDLIRIHPFKDHHVADLPIEGQHDAPQVTTQADERPLYVRVHTYVHVRRS